MKPTTLLCILITSMVLTAKVQAQGEELVLTYEENLEWIENLKSAGLAESLEMIKKGMLADTNVYYIGTRNAHGKDSIPEGFIEKSYYRPLYLFLSEGEKPLFFSADMDKSTVAGLNEYLKPENITGLEIATGTRATALYGSRAISSVIKCKLRTSRNSTSFRNFKSEIFNPEILFGPKAC